MLKIQIIDNNVVDTSKVDSLIANSLELMSGTACPTCGEELGILSMLRSTNELSVKCGMCNFTGTMELN